MEDLISRKAILKHIEKIRQDALMMDDLYRASIIMNGMYLCEEAVEKVVRNQSSAQPEHKKGKWIDEKINSYTSRTYCSKCGNSAPFICVSGDHYGRNMHGEVKKTKFCPNCGADMREESENE